MSDAPQLTWHDHRVERRERERLNGHKGCVAWFTGLSGSGKSTIANLVDQQLHAAGVHTFLLDGDNVRMGLNAPPALLASEYSEEFARRFGLDFAPLDREENIRRVGAVAQLFCSAGVVALVALVSPYRRDRDALRRRMGSDFVEIFVDAPLAVCEQRDPKGLYRKARAGEVANFTGVHDPYEPPLTPELRLDTAARSPDDLAAEVTALLRTRILLGA